MSKERVLDDLGMIKNTLDILYDEICMLKEDKFSIDNLTKFENLVDNLQIVIEEEEKSKPSQKTGDSNEEKRD